MRRNGETTYFANDVAYHEDKLERGYDRMINLLGSDHHGYIARMKACMAALGVDPDRLELPILQFVHIVEGGRRASMSKRRGDFVTLDDLIAEIGVDATRYFMLSRSHDSTIDLDVELAKRRSATTPSTTCSTTTRAAPRSCARWTIAGRVTRMRRLELHASERELIKKLLAFPGEVAEAGERRAPHKIAAYALELSQAFAAFYRDCPVRDAGSDALRSLRLGQVRATRRSSPARWACWGSRRRTRCDDALVERLLALERGLVDLVGLRVGLERAAERRARPASPRAPRGRARRAAARALGDAGEGDGAAERIRDDLRPGRGLAQRAAGRDDAARPAGRRR